MMRFVSSKLAIALVCSGLANSSWALSEASQNRLEQLINSGEFEQARIVLEQQPHDRADVLLLEGRILKARGELSKAEPILRDALALRPKSLPIRRELAHLLYLRGRDTQANHHLTILQRNDPSPQLQRGYRDIKNKIQQRRPFRFDGFVELAPSTNINGGSTRTYVDTALGPLVISEGSRAKSGTGLRFGGSVQYRRALSPVASWSLGLEAERVFYPEAPEENATTARLSFRYLRGGPVAWEIGPFLSRTWRGDDDNVERLGVAGAVHVQLAVPDRLSFSGSVAHRRDFPTNGDHGPEWSVTAQYQHHYSAAGKWSLALSANGFPGAEMSHNRYKSLTLQAGITQAWRGGIVSELLVFSGARQFDGVAPLQDQARRDHTSGLEGRVHLTRTQVFGLSPIVSCHFRKNRSNVALYSSETTGCGLRLTRSF